MSASSNPEDVERERRDSKATLAAAAEWENEGGAPAPPRAEKSLMARWLARIATFKLGRAESVPKPEVPVLNAVNPPDRVA